MQRLVYYLLLALVLSFPAPNRALEIDEKLPLRILKTSQSKKTILINRGLEDGLVVSDHAKFFVTEGVVARGVVIKASPTRSVWALYRIIDAQMLVEQKVMNLKISSAVELTDDPSKMLASEDIPEYNRGKLKYYNDTSIPYYQGRIAPVYKGEPMPKEELSGVKVKFLESSTSELSQLEELENSPKNEIEDVSTFERRALKSMTTSNVWQASFALGGLSSQVESENDVATSSGSGSFGLNAFSLKIERYFLTNSFWRNISLGFYFNLGEQNSFDPVGFDQSTSYSEYGLLLSYYFNSPFAVKQFQFAGTLGLGVGGVEDSYQDQNLSGAVIVGSSNHFHIGAKTEYLFNANWGSSLELSYYNRSETYEFDGLANIEKNHSGTRILAGIGYRF